MEPLLRVTTIHQILRKLIQRGFSMNEIYHYLKMYNPNVLSPNESNTKHVTDYFSSQVMSFSNDMILKMVNEIGGEIIESNIFGRVNIFNQTIANASCWQDGFYRIFLSHLTRDKILAAKLKEQLAQYGIDCFVAHENIRPTKLWLSEIEKALASMDFLCAIITPNFYKSKWCDQEIGIALGRSIPILLIKHGADPHGFIGKYQAITITTKDPLEDIAKNIFATLCNMENANQKYFNTIGRLFLNSKNQKDALKWITLINTIPNFSEKIMPENIQNLFMRNHVLNSKDIILEFNKLVKNKGRE